MASMWPLLAVAGAGALHGLNPATGWALAAAWGLRTGDRSRALWALVPIAVGHVASVGLVAIAVSLGVAIDRGVVQKLAVVLLVATLVLHLSCHAPKAARVPASYAGLTLWSFITSSAHGAGLMLVPVLMPLCSDGGGARLDVHTSLVFGLAAVGIHMLAMLAATGAVAVAVGQGAVLMKRQAVRMYERR